MLGLLCMVLLMICALSTESKSNQQAGHNSLTLKNNSDHTIDEFYFSRTGNEFWGVNQLGNNALQPRQAFKRDGVSAGEYDVKFVDRNGRSCILQRVRILDDFVYELTNDWLSKCESETRS